VGPDVVDVDEHTGGAVNRNPGVAEVQAIGGARFHVGTTGMFQSRRVTRSTGSMISGLSGDGGLGIAAVTTLTTTAVSSTTRSASAGPLPTACRQHPQLNGRARRLRQRVFRVPSRQLRRDAGGAQLGVITADSRRKGAGSPRCRAGSGDGGPCPRQLALLEFAPPRERRARDLVQLCGNSYALRRPSAAASR